MRHTSPGSDKAMVDARNDYWMPMDQYIGGIEHAILHLLYARFWTKVMRDIGLIKADEPADRLLCQGMVLNHIYSRKNEKGGIEYFWPSEVENIEGSDGKVTTAKLKDGTIVNYDGVGTMSKSKSNGVDPQEIIDQHGADTARLYTMFTAPPEQTLEWSDLGVQGSARFLRRLWVLGANRSAAIQSAATSVDLKAASTAQKAVRKEIYQCLKQANYDFERIQYNTVVSACMKMLNTLEATPAETDAVGNAILRECMSVLIRVLYPVTPHIACALWVELGYAQQQGDLLDAPWPEMDESALVSDEISLVVQVNGKLRGQMTVAASATREAIEAQARASEIVAKYIEGEPIKKVIVVPGKLVNIVA
jgi:leucyl-tRNA synthetase